MPYWSKHNGKSDLAQDNRLAFVRRDGFDFPLNIKCRRIHHLKFNRAMPNHKNLFGDHAGVFVQFQQAAFKAVGFDKVPGGFAEGFGLAPNRGVPIAQVKIVGKQALPRNPLHCVATGARSSWKTHLAAINRV